MEESKNEIEIAPKFDEKTIELINFYKDEFKGTLATTILNLLEQHHHGSFLKWKQKWLGNTSYIDRIWPTDLAVPIMWGFDNLDRLFITVRTYIARIETKAKGKPIEIENRDKPIDFNKMGAETFFQRYSDSPDTYTSGTPTLHYSKEIISSRMYRDEFEQFSNLLIRGTTILTREDYSADHQIVTKVYTLVVA